MKKCSKCQEEKPESEFHVKVKKTGQLQAYCKPCLYSIQKQRWKDRKVKAIEYKGGKCVDCNQTYPAPVYQFHHLNPEEKEFSWNKGRLMSWDKVKKELDKCVLLCANCHMLRHSDL